MVGGFNNLSPSLQYTTCPIMACLKVLITHGQLSDKKISGTITSIYIYINIGFRFERNPTLMYYQLNDHNCYQHNWTVWHSCDLSAIFYQITCSCQLQIQLFVNIIVYRTYTMYSSDLCMLCLWFHKVIQKFQQIQFLLPHLKPSKKEYQCSWRVL